MSVVFVVGNGRSRLNVDLESLRQYGQIYGCNGLYRDFTPDVLVSTDDEISLEIQRSSYAKNNKHYTRYPYADSGSMRLPHESKAMCSGANAIFLAIRNNAKNIVMLGYDFGSVDGAYNNVYAGTQFYKHHHERPSYAGDWIPNISKMVELHRNVKFTRAISNDSKADIFQHKNYAEISMDEFKSRYK